MARKSPSAKNHMPVKHVQVLRYQHREENSRRRSEGLNVSLSATGNSKVHVSVTNTGTSETPVLIVNTLLDKSPTKKVTVYKEGSEKEVPFKGIHIRHYPSSLTRDAFQLIAPGQTIETELDLAETFDLSENSTYIVSAEGIFPFSDAKSTRIAGVIPYKSNEIRIKVNDKQSSNILSARAKHHNLARRADFGNGGCNDQQKAVIARALKRASNIATQASSAAQHGDARLFEQYFRTTDRTIRKQVSDRFRAIANEAESSIAGTVKYQCHDAMNVCSRPGAIAYAVSGSNIVVNCPIFYSAGVSLHECDSGDRALTVIHEFSHIDAVYYPATTDIAYGEDASIALTPDMAFRNADNYIFYANAIRQNCSPS
ncbi:deuterolysin metalloprotease [Histoplasma capsulatum var. duboisii H88]|uniref:Neutral protease 2 n=1 Tax=Ajellomyces capsulatus (strain H88) TaxID=544711 RepID=F0UU13_AJEC8|nr:deuterolysin metalloprotease [Histoplasma capsulatum var. duboisii H88]